MSRGWQSGWQSGWQFGQQPGQQPGQQAGPPPPLQLWWGQLPQRPAAAEVAPSTPIRIGDAERDKAVSDLGDHFAAGRLNREEFDERADQAMQARFSTELAPLFADLPVSQPVAPTHSGPGRAGGPPPWAYAMWLFPVLLVAAVAGAILLHAPFILWFGVWLLVIGRLTGHKHRYRRQQQGGSGQPGGVSRPGLR